MYPNEGPLWPCGCLMGEPNCACDIPVYDGEQGDVEVVDDEVGAA